jgi:BirA family biotin operon repressor/biotin-[acetyl-CoA-carboxylase] ligase
MSRRWTFEVFDRLPSTNDSILIAGESHAPEGTTHIARTQSRGRGRGDHTWWSPPGAGLWMSTLLRPTRERSRWGGISLLAGAAVRRAVEGLGVRGVALYWPNDLQVGRRKLGGILGEVRSRGERAWVALGIGINIDLTSSEARASMPAELRPMATSLVEAGPPSTTDPLEIAESVLESFFGLYARFLAGESVPRIAGEDLAHAGRSVEVRVAGNGPWRGVVEGLGPDGELLVRRQGSPRELVTVTGGEVIYEDEA